jgi:hypothetical protein
MESFATITKRSFQFNQSKFDSDWRWKLLEELYEKNFINNSDFSTHIPKKIHQIWLGSPIPDKYRDWGNTWKKFNPDWQYKLWTDDDIDDLKLPNRKLYDSVNNLGAKSDLLRYHILNEFGGIYVDTDFECLKSFNDLTYLEFFSGVGYPSDIEIYVGILGCYAHHPIMEKIVSAIYKTDHEFIAKDVFNATSSYFFTKQFFSVVQEYQKGIVIFPTDYFYPFPNSKGHDQRNGRDFIKECSYGVHHWEVSWAVKFDGRDWIQGDKFKELSDYVYAPRHKSNDDYDQLENTFFPPVANDKPVYVYTHNFYVKQLFLILKHLRGSFVVISHNGDNNIDSSYIIPDNVIKWYAQNVNIKDPKIESIPIGLQNNRWLKQDNKKVIIVEQLKKPRQNTNLVYLNCDVNTNPSKRKILYMLFDKKPWVTSVKGRNGFNVKDYFKNLYDHKFVLCPEGNGIDTHRIWETLYVGSIPIIKRNINSQYYTDLPICFVDRWEDITESFLIKEHERIISSEWNLAKLNFSFWKNKIKKIE